MRFIEPAEILNSTNGGLDIILSYYPDAHKSVERQGVKFKLRADEKTASANVRRMPDGTYIVTDFGGDQKPRNAILICMLEENCDYKTALNLLAERFNIAGSENSAPVHKADYSKRPAKPEEEDGKYYYEIRGSFSNAEIETLFSEKIIETIRLECRDKDGKVEEDKVYSKFAAVLKRYHFHSVDSYTYIKNREALVFKANDTYPIFLIDEGDFKKLYQPKNSDKGRRFLYIGKKTEKDFIHGYQQLQRAFQERQNETTPVEENPEEGESSKGGVNKLDEVILCTGGSDAINVAALGYHVIWLNSETAPLTGKAYTDISRIVKNFYNLPDLDSTGKQTAHELAMKYLEIKTIELPESLAEKKDRRGNPCKDVRDFFRYYGRKAFAELLTTALPYRFWDRIPKFNKNNDFIKYDYQFNNVQAYNFLKKNGFYRFKSENEKEGYIFIRITDNIVSQIDANDIKNFIHAFLEERKMDIELRNMFYRSTQLGEGSLSNLPITDVDFTDFDKRSQYFFFMNKTWHVTSEAITELRPKDVKRFVWEQEVISHRATLLEAPFTITKDEFTGDLDITIHNTDDYFFRYLIQTSRIHWREELEHRLYPLPHEQQVAYREKHKFDIAGPLLTAQEIKEQKDHLINKIYVLGYLLHRYKEPSRPWCVFAMDAKLSDEGESHGGSGKSIAFRSVRYFMNTVTLDGRNPKLTDNPHIYERVTKHTDYILIDDANQYLKFNFFFAPLTGELTVNPKNNKQYEIPYKDVPKFAITSNYTVRDLDPSTERRLLYTVFSDYYHHAGGAGDYHESRSPKDDFGITLFDDFNESHWNLFFNFMAQCCKTYMSWDKIDPPMDNVTKRNLLSEMGTTFHAWADVFFSEHSGNLDAFVERQKAFKNFVDENKMGHWTPQKFGKALRAWCKYRGFLLNPKEVHTSGGRIIRKVDVLPNQAPGLGEKRAVEMLYIQTKDKIEVQPEDNLPF